MAIFSILCPWDKIKCPYLGSGAKNDKSKTTFPSQTLKVGENKVPLFQCLMAPIRRYGHLFKIMSMGQFQTVLRVNSCPSYIDTE